MCYWISWTVQIKQILLYSLLATSGRSRIFLRWGHQLAKWVLFCTFLLKTTWKRKILDPEGGACIPAALIGSANGHAIICGDSWKLLYWFKPNFWDFISHKLKNINWASENSQKVLDLCFHSCLRTNVMCYSTRIRKYWCKTHVLTRITWHVLLRRSLNFCSCTTW